MRSQSEPRSVGTVAAAVLMPGGQEMAWNNYRQGKCELDTQRHRSVDDARESPLDIRRLDPGEQPFRLAHPHKHEKADFPCGKPAFCIRDIWSGREDLNLRPLGPEPSALPG